MKNYKIGRCYFQEISEEEYCKLFDDGYRGIFSLNDYDGDPIKYFRRSKKK